MFKPLTITECNLSMMNKHFIIASKNMCSKSPINCRKRAENFARAVSIIKSTPEIDSCDWRNNNPTLFKNYYDSLLIFDTKELYYEIKKIIEEAFECECICSIIIRSNDGLTAADPNQQSLVE